jgi:hypothetical protein
MTAHSRCQNTPSTTKETTKSSVKDPCRQHAGSVGQSKTLLRFAIAGSLFASTLEGIFGCYRCILFGLFGVVNGVLEIRTPPHLSRFSQVLLSGCEFIGGFLLSVGRSRMMQSCVGFNDV